MLTFDKTHLVRHMIDVYASEIISLNLDMHTEFYRVVQAILAARDDNNIVRSYKHVRYLRNHNHLSKCRDFDKETQPSHELWQKIHAMEKIEGLKVLDEYIIDDHVVKAIQFLYICLLRQTDLREAVSIVNYLLNQKHKNVMAATKNADICDVLFSVMLLVNCHEDIKRYIKISKELFHVKASRTQAMAKRTGLVYVSMHTLYYRYVDPTILQRPPKEIDPKSQYLFVICEKDDEAIYEVYRDKKHSYMAKLATPKKNVQISDAFCPKKETTKIVKM